MKDNTKLKSDNVENVVGGEIHWKHKEEFPVFLESDRFVFLGMWTVGVSVYSLNL